MGNLLSDESSPQSQPLLTTPQPTQPTQPSRPPPHTISSLPRKTQPPPPKQQQKQQTPPTIPSPPKQKQSQQIQTINKKPTIQEKNNENDQLPAYMLKYTILANLSYSYPTYFYLGLSLYSRFLNEIKNATFTSVNEKKLIGLKPYITSYNTTQGKEIINKVLSYESRSKISNSYNKDLQDLLKYEKNHGKKKEGAKSKTTLNKHQFDINHHLNMNESKDFLNKDIFKNNYATIYIHTSDDLSCYIIADIQNINEPEIHVVFRGSRSLKNAISDIKGLTKKKLCE